MTSITIHALDKDLDTKIREYAKLKNLSLNKSIKKLLSQRLGIVANSKTVDHSQSFVDLFGTWSITEKNEFSAITADLDEIDLKDWQ